MKRLTLRILFLELIEQIIRLDSFLGEASQHSPGHRLKFIESFIALVARYRDSLGQQLSNFQRTSDVQLKPVFMFLMLLSDELQKDYNLLSLILDPWADPETYTFLRGLFNPPYEIYNKIEPTIVLVPAYTFWEWDVRQHWEQSFVQPPESAIVLALPITQKHNPLMWAILAHEMGHAIALHRNLTKDLYASLKEEAPVHADKIAKWANEFCADLLALRLLGPAYLFSFITFVVSMRTEFDAPSPSHPSINSRVDKMESKLRAMGIDISQNSRLSNLKALKAVFDTRHELDREIGLKHRFEEPKLPMSLKEIADWADKAQQRVVLPEFSLDMWMESDHLVQDRLKQGCPINAWRASKVEKEIHSALPKVHSEKDPRKAYDALLPKLNEEPSSPAIVLNAGWQYKFEERLRQFEKIFLKDTGSNMTIKFEAYKKTMIDDLDRVLRKSIETALLHSYLRDVDEST